LGITAVRLARKKKAKLIFNVSDLWPESAEKLGIVKNKFLLGISYRLERWIYKNSFFITGQTQGIVKNISNRFPDKKVYWLPNGVDLNFYNPSSKLQDWRKEKKFSEDDFILLYAGIIGHAQGLEVILKSAEKFISKDKIKFILLGNGPVKDELMEQKNKLNLNNVFFFDAVSKDKMPAIVNSISASIIPLKKLELFKGAIPSKIFETLAMQKPVLLGVEGEAKDLFINEGNCGLAFEPENPEDLAKKILVLYNDRKLLQKLGENGRNYVMEKFNRDNIAKVFDSILQEIK
jgi:glycosyltransferase involved in cell wall biosynthesis